MKPKALAITCVDQQLERDGCIANGLVQVSRGVDSPSQCSSPVLAQVEAVGQDGLRVGRAGGVEEDVDVDGGAVVGPLAHEHGVGLQAHWRRNRGHGSDG